MPVNKESVKCVRIPQYAHTFVLISMVTTATRQQIRNRGETLSTNHQQLLVSGYTSISIHNRKNLCTSHSMILTFTHCKIPLTMQIP